MSSLKQAFALTLLTILPMTGYSVCTNSWTNGSADGVWNEAGNWGGGCVPGASAVTAQDAATFPDTASGNLSVHLDTGAMPVSPGLNQLTFNNTATSYTINTNSMAINPFFLQFNGATPQVSVLSGFPIISANMMLEGPSTLTMDIGFGGSLSLTQGLNSTGVTNVTKTGSGVVYNEWNGVNVFNQFALSMGTLTISAGTFNNFNTLPITNGNLGTEILSNATLLNGGTMNFNNTGTITDNAVGSTMTIVTGLTMTSGGLQVVNDGIIQSMMTTGGGIGCRVEMSTDWNMTGGNVLILNRAAVQSTNFGTGCSLTTDGALNFSGTSFSNGNSAAVSSNGGMGSSVDTATGISITGGDFFNSNTGTISNGGLGGIISTTQNLTLSNATVSNLNGGMVSGAGSVGAQISASSIFINSGSFSNTNSGSASGGAVGALVLAPVQLAVSGGTFTNNDTVRSAAVQVNAGGTMAGIGVFQDAMGGSNTMVTNAGTVVPGGPGPGSAPGTMTIQGSYSQTSVGTLVINLLNPASFSQLDVSGPAQVGGHLELGLAPGATIAPGDTYKIVLGNGVTGTFADIINFNLGNLNPRLQYFPDFVLLSFLFPVAPPTAVSQASRYVNYLEPLFSSVNHLNLRLYRQMAQLRRQFTLFREEPSASTYTAAIPETSQLLADNSEMIALNPQVEEKQEQLKETVMAPHQTRPWNFYFGPLRDVGRVLTKKDNAGFHYDSVGALAGFDYAFSKLGIGFLVDYEHMDGRGAHQWGKFDINEAHGSLYATYVRSAERQLAFNLILGGGYEWYSIHRKVPAVSQTAKGSPQGVEYDVLGGMEYTFEKQKYEGMPEHLQIIPLVNIQYIYLHVNKYQERGAGDFNLHFDSQIARSLRSTLGTRLNYLWKWGNVSFRPEINLAWQREYADKSRRIGLSGGGLSAQLHLPQSGRNVALAGLDFLVTFFDRYGIEGSYDFEWNSLYLDHFFYLGCNFRF
ncbi:MAG: autotransporter domain-containing protein [Verrucomicrobia bacterium]|nr:autotransporter domain-containing protein [Verrucomicrobiota bacterium]